MIFGKNTWAAKIKRTIFALFPISKERKGNCIHCGKCCMLPVRCFFLKNNGGRSYCSIYKIRPLNCRKYPRTEGEWLTKSTCGYRFG